MGRYFRDGEPDWREFERLARRGFGRFADMADESNLRGWGDNFRVGRMLAAGDVRLVALYLIDLEPRHGYDLIKTIEERSNGVYAPSPGLVYPALTYLEEAGYVTSEPDGNKKRYTITDAGRAHLEENREAVASTLDFLARAGEQVNRFREFARREWPTREETGPFNETPGPDRGYDEQRDTRTSQPGRGGWEPREQVDRDIEDVLPEVNAARRELKAAIKKARKADADTQHRLAEIMRKAAADIRSLDADDDVDI